MKYIYLDGKRYVWRDIVKLRAAQIRALKKAHQLPPIDVKKDCKPLAPSTPRRSSP
jgi:hypothetical protein